MTDKFGYRLGVSLSDQKGFTLLETMIGMMIFAIGFAAVLSMQMTGIKAHTTSRAQVATVHDAVLQSETLVPAYLYNDGLLTDDGGNATTPDTYDGVDMPVGGSANASYNVRDGYIVSQVKIVYLSNKRDANDRKFTLRLAVPDMGRVK